jgi:hypothetical protein
MHDSAFAHIRVAEDGMCELWDWGWYGRRDPHRPYRLTDPNDKALWDTMKKVWKWLEEYELVELRPIGPEDYEFFATDKLLGGSFEIELEVESDEDGGE